MSEQEPGRDRPDLEQIERWLVDAVEGAATPEDSAQMNAALTADAQLRAELVRRLVDESLIRQELQVVGAESLFRGDCILPRGARLDDSGEFTVVPSAVSAVPPSAGATWGWLAVAAALLLAAAPLSWLTWRAWNQPPSLPVQVITGTSQMPPSAPVLPPELLDSDAVAILTKSVNVQWDVDGGAPARVDSRIGTRRLKFASGILQLEFFSGATVILEGPADLEIVSAMRCDCRYGKLRADVPPQAIGFTIGGGGVDVVDLGTAFAMRVDPAGAGEVHVIDGEVSLRRPGSDETRQLKLGEGVRFDSAGTITDVSGEVGEFVDAAQLKALEQARRGDAYQRWLKQSQRWASDPDIALYYNFEQVDGSDRRLRSAIPEAPPKADGAIVGCRWVEGRFAGKRALEFKRTSDRVRIDLDEVFTSISLVAWFRVEGFHGWYGSLLMADGYATGVTHWQINQEGALKLSVGADRLTPSDRPYNSPPIITPNDMGRWVQVASVYDSEARVVRHYLDGELRAEREIVVPSHLWFGAAEIGNWNPQKEGRNAIRSLNGLLDEIAIFRRPLTAEEIRESYEAGDPYP